MARTTPQLLFRTGGASSQGYYVREVYGVADDANQSCNLGPIDVMTMNGIPKFGMSYDPPDSCDSAVGNLVVSEMEVSEPEQDETKTMCGVKVTVLYKEVTTDQNQQRPFPWINNDNDPLTWAPTIDISSSPRSMPAARMYFLGAYQHDPTNVILDPCAAAAVALLDVNNQVLTFLKNSWQPTKSSANEPLAIPPLELDVADQVITITRNLSSWDPDGVFHCYQPSGINNASTRLQVSQWAFDKTYPQHTLKMARITGRPQYRQWTTSLGVPQSRTYWETTFEIHYRPGGWYRDLENAGTHRVLFGLSQNQPDAKGGEINYATRHAGEAPTGDIEVDGRPIVTPVPLDLMGQPMQPGPPSYYFRYLDGFPKNFSASSLHLPIGS